MPASVFVAVLLWDSMFCSELLTDLLPTLTASLGNLRGNFYQQNYYYDSHFSYVSGLIVRMLLLLFQCYGRGYISIESYSSWLT